MAKVVRLIGVLVSLASAGGSPDFAQAQNYSGYGQSWSSVYGFGSPSDQSVGLQRADMIRKAENGVDQPVITTNNYYDNRAGYVETNSGGGDVLGNSQIGDQIGQQTYSVGALNTGSTTVTVDGSNNIIEANNSASSHGCVDGSISTGGTGLEGSADWLTALSEHNLPPTFSFNGADVMTSGCAAAP